MHLNKEKKKGYIILAIILLLIVFLHLAIFGYAEIYDKTTKSLGLSKEFTFEEKTKLYNNYNASEYQVNNCRWDNNCYYCDVKIGNWENTHREITCDSKANTEIEIKKNIRWTMRELIKEDVVVEKVIDTTEYKETIQ